jgi:hypothetical protein
MIVHVAAHSEAKGRVVLRITRTLSPAALEAAGRIARGYDAEIDAVLIEDENLFAATAYPFARELSPSGRFVRRLDARAMSHAYAGLGRRVSGMVTAWSTRHAVPARFRCVRGAPPRMLAQACAENGPWNVVVFAEPYAATDGDLIEDVFTGIPDTTGLVLVGEKAAPSAGPVVVLVERSEHLSPMLRIAERVIGDGEQQIAVLPLPDDSDAGRRLDGDLRLALAAAAEGSEASERLLAPVRLGSGMALLTKAIVAEQPTLIIARSRGVFRGQAKGVAELIRQTNAAVFLTRD